MKKIVSLLLCAVLMLCCVSVVSAANVGSDKNISDYPVVIVPGFTSSTFYCIDETGNQKPVWGTDPLGQITSNSSKERALAIAKEAAKFAVTGDADGLAKVLNDGFKRIFAEFSCTPDGQPVCPAYNYVNTAEETNFKNLREAYPDGTYQSEAPVADVLAEQIGYENIFLFTNDFRLGAVEAAFGAYVPEDVVSYIQLLCEKGRISCFYDSVEEYNKLLDESERISNAKITSAVPLTDEEKQKLKEKLQDMCERAVEMEFFVDEAIMGGIVAEIDGRVLDGSLRSRLRDIKEVINT
jgi:ATP synthase F1 delta subunit